MKLDELKKIVLEEYRLKHPKIEEGIIRFLDNTIPE